MMNKTIQIYNISIHNQNYNCKFNPLHFNNRKYNNSTLKNHHLNISKILMQ